MRVRTLNCVGRRRDHERGLLLTGHIFSRTAKVVGILRVFQGRSERPPEHGLYWVVLREDPDENMRLLDEVIKNKVATSPLPFIRMLKDMSTIKRRGWMKRGMDLSMVESNASHSWGVAVICLPFSPKVCVISSPYS